MASLDDVRRLVAALPGTAEAPSYGGAPAWKVGGRLIVWERPLRQGDREALGEAAPDGVLLGVHLADLGIKEALLADEPGVFLTVPHLDGHAVVLVRLDAIGLPELEELVLDAWTDRAPKRVLAAWEAERASDPSDGADT